MASEGRKRRQILVDADLQVGLSMHILGWLYFYVVLFALAANAPSLWAVATAPASDPGYAEAVEHLRWFTQYTVLPLALTFVCVAVHGVFFTHRVAGPIFRIKSVLRGMAQRRYPAGGVKLREKDFFKDVAAEMDVVLESVREDAARLRRMNQETLASAREVVAALERTEPVPHEALTLSHLMLDRAERLDRHLSAAEPETKAPRVPLPEAEISGCLPAAASPAAPAASVAMTQVTAGPAKPPVA